MTEDGRGISDFNKFRNVRRKAVSFSQEELVKTEYFDSLTRFPLVMRPNVENLNPSQWGANNRELIESELVRHGAILFRDFGISGPEAFAEFARAVTPELLDYRERAAPRREVGPNIYTSTEYPPDQHIPLHHEMSYSHNWPLKLWFYCDLPAVEGGATPIASDRVVFQRIDPKIKEIFMEKKVMYTRNFSEGFDLPWQDVFQTTDKSVVENYCRQANTEFEWRDGNRLRTRQVRQAVAVHPKTGETVWFNHAHMFHTSNLSPLVRESLLAEFTEEYLPRNAYYGDGSPIPDAVLEEIREIYRQAAVAFEWRRGDVLFVDNILASHGRHPFTGPRKVLVAMSELYVNEAFQVSNPFIWS